MNDKSIVIVGYGVVGKLLAKELVSLCPDIYDKYKPDVNHITQSHHHIGFICVDTPYIDTSPYLDTTQVECAILENSCDIYVIKSTCPIGTVTMLKEKTGKHILFSPEYYGATQHCLNFNQEFTILGGDGGDADEVIQVLQKVYDGRHIFCKLTSNEAEIVKLMVNSYLAMKVTFCNEFARVCKSHGASYESVREAFVLDARITPAHTFVYDDAPYWNSHCFNKDVPAVANENGIELLRSVVNINDKYKEICDADK